jgi:hypothetical protein
MSKPNDEMKILENKSGVRGTGTSLAGFVTADKQGRPFICGTCEYFDQKSCGQEDVTAPDSAKQICETYPKLPNGKERKILEDGRLEVAHMECCSFHEFRKLKEKKEE